MLGVIRRGRAVRVIFGGFMGFWSGFWDGSSWKINIFGKY
jgi:hypothetical protein